MKVPVYQQKAEASLGGVPGQAPQVPMSNAGESYGQAGAVAGHLVDQAMAEQKRADAEYEHEKYKASVSLARDALTSYNQQTTDTLYGSTSTAPPEIGDQPGNDQMPGFLSTQGRKAAETSADTLKMLETKRQQIAAGITDAEARKLFLQESASTYAQSHRTVEEHVARQVKVAQEDSINAAADEAVRAAAVDPVNSDLARERIGGVVGPLHALAGDRPEWVQQQALKVQGQVAAARLNALIERKDADNAERVLQENRYALGQQLPHYDEAVRLLREKSHADSFALELVNGARSQNGFVDAAKAIEALQALPEDKRTPEVEAAFGKWLSLENEKKKTVVEGKFNTGFTAFLQRHSLHDIDAGTEAWLRSNDPDGWHRLEQMAKAHREGGPPTAEQMSAMTRFLVDAADHPDKYATMPVEEFNREWAPFLSRHDLPRAGELLAHMHGQAQKPEKLSPLEDKMLLQMGREAGVFPDKQNDPSKWGEEEAQAYFIAQQVLSEKAREFKQRNGKPPTSKDVEDWTKELLLKGTDPDSFVRKYLGMGGKTTRLQQMVKGEGAGFAPEWDEADKKKAADYLQKQNARVDDAAIDALLRKVHGLPALPIQADSNAKAPDEVDPGRWGLELEAPPKSGEEDSMSQTGAGGGSAGNGAGY